MSEPSRRGTPTIARPARATSPFAGPSTEAGRRPSASSALQPVSSSNAALTYRIASASATQTAAPSASSTSAPAGGRRMVVGDERLTGGTGSENGRRGFGAPPRSLPGTTPRIRHQTGSGRRLGGELDEHLAHAAG